MKILLTGATGYIGKRLLPVLLEEGHHVVCCVRDKSRFIISDLSKSITVIEVDFLKESSLSTIPDDIDVAYYLIHSMSSDSDEFDDLESLSAQNFVEQMAKTNVSQIIYLSGIVNDATLSKHLASRKNVETILRSGAYHLTTMRAGIIIGSGSASFEIIRDLVEKLPVMIAPKWLKTKSQPIGVRDVIEILKRSLLNEQTYDQVFDIGGPDVFTYKEMLLLYAKKRKLRRWIISVPVLSPKLSSYWLYFVTSTTFSLAVNLVNSMKVEVICRDNRIMKILDIKPMTYDEAIDAAFVKIEQNAILSSWKDSFVSGRMDSKLSEFIQVPVNGCFKDKQVLNFSDRDAVLQKIWSIGGENGWYYGNWLWKIRGFIDKIFGGVGLRRGRTSPTEINAGDALDFWRVLLADKDQGRLLLYAEMKLPGEAWLEFKVEDNTIIQEATFRPRGLNGRLYWYASMPFHYFIFNGMIRKICG